MLVAVIRCNGLASHQACSGHNQAKFCLSKDKIPENRVGSVKKASDGCPDQTPTDTRTCMPLFGPKGQES